MKRVGKSTGDEFLKELVKDEAKVFGLLTGSYQDVYWICDLSLNIHYVSPNIFQQTGYRVDEFMKLSLEDRYTRESVQTILEAFEQEMLLEQDTSSNKDRNHLLELEHKKIDGGTFWISVNACFIRDGDGTPIGVLGSSRDISELKQVQLALAESESRYRTITENLHEVIYLCRNDDYYSMHYLSETVENLIGFRASDFQSGKLSFVELYHPEDRDMIISRVDEAIRQKESFVLQYRLKHKDGSWRWIEEKGKGIYDKERVVFLEGSLVDITERKQAESEIAAKNAALIASETRYRELSSQFRLMADTEPDMLWAKDLNREYIFVNRAICDKLLCAESIDEPIGKTDMFFAQRERNRHPDDPNWHTFGEICRDSDGITLDAMQTMQFDEFGNIRGKFLFLDVYKAPLVDETGKLIGVVGSARDITKQKAMEQNLQRESEFRQLLMEVSTEYLKPTLLQDENDIYQSLVKIAMFLHAERAYIFDYDSGSGMCSNTYEWCAENARSTVAN